MKDKGLLELEDKKKFKKFDLAAKMFTHFIRVKRSKKLKELPLGLRNDIDIDQIEH